MGQVIPSMKSVLIVEDEVLIRLEVVDFFEDAGYEVHEAGGADEAIKLLTRYPHIGVVITDVQMPGSMDGLRLSHYIRDRYPPVLLAIVSGHANLGEGDLPTNCFFMSKPFDLKRMLRKIEGPALD